MFISSFALASVVGYVSIASAQNLTTDRRYDFKCDYGKLTKQQNYWDRQGAEKLTGNNTQFNNTVLSNLTTGISEGVSNFTGNNSALANYTTGISEEMSNITANMVDNQSGNQTGNQS